MGEYFKFNQFFNDFSGLPMWLISVTIGLVQILKKPLLLTPLALVDLSFNND